MLTSNSPLKSQVYAKLLIGERNKTAVLEMYGDLFFIIVIMISLYWVRSSPTQQRLFPPDLEWCRQVMIHLLGTGMEQEPNSPEACGLLEEGDLLYKLGYLL